MKHGRRGTGGANSGKRRTAAASLCALLVCGMLAACGGVAGDIASPGDAPAQAVSAGNAAGAADPERKDMFALPETAFEPYYAPESVQRAAQPLGEYAELAIDAAVEIPAARAYPVLALEARSFAADELEEIFGYLSGKPCELPGGGADAQTTLTDAKGRTATASAHSGGRSLYYSYYEYLLREEWVLADVDAPDHVDVTDELAAFEGAFPLTMEQCRPLADEALRRIGATGLTLDFASRACAFAQNEAGGKTVLTKGWDFVYTRDLAGLPSHCYMGRGGAPNDPLCYDAGEAETVWIFVDADGVSRVDWRNACAVKDTLVSNAALLPFPELLACITARITRMYRYTDTSSVTVEKLRLASMTLRDPDGALLLAPVMEAVCTVRSPGWAETAILPMNAVDGGAATIVYD